MALCCQNPVSKNTNQRYGLHSTANRPVHYASITVLGLLHEEEEEEEELVQNDALAIFRLAI